MSTQPTRQKTQRFAWDGVSFQVPECWNLAAHGCRRGASSVDLEDDTSLRLQAEWTRPGVVVDADVVRKRCRKLSAELQDAAGNARTPPELPEHWTALPYVMPDGRQFILAYCLPPDASFFFLLRLHFSPDDPEPPDRMLTTIVRTFSRHVSEPVPWAYYDVSFELAPEFRLYGTALQAGRKSLIFHWGLRRFFVWHVSLADVVLRKHALNEWATRFLNDTKLVRGPTFETADDGSIGPKRRSVFPLAHYEEIGRMCFRYKAAVQHLESKNQIALWLFNYRREADLRHWPEALPPLP